MRIKWFGHSCFLLTLDNGMRILTDPFSKQVGYSIPLVHADIVTISHDHYDHNNAGMVKGEYTLLNKTGTYNSNGIEIKGIETFHDNQKGAKKGKNIIFKYSTDNLKICHCGDLGHVPDSSQVLEIGDVDVLLLPVGGTFTIDAAGAVQVMKLLKPSVTIPMHFKTAALNFPINGVDRFASMAGKVTKAGKQEMEIEREKLPELSGVVILEYK